MLSLYNTSPSLFTLVHNTDVNRLGEITSAVTDRVRNSSLTPIAEKDIVAGRLVAAKFVVDKEEAYYRATVTRLSRRNQIAEVLFFDHGNFDQVDLKDIYPLPADLVKEPIVPLYCTLSGESFLMCYFPLKVCQPPFSFCF